MVQIIRPYSPKHDHARDALGVLDQAREAADNNDTTGASLLAWQAAVDMVTAVAASRQLDHVTEAALVRVVAGLSNRRNDYELLRRFALAMGLRHNADVDWLDQNDLAVLLAEVRNLIIALDAVD